MNYSPMHPRLPSCVQCFVIGLTLIVGQHALLAQQKVDPKTIVGRDSCQKCHASEQLAWAASGHGTSAWKLLSHPKAPDFGQKMGIANVESASSICAECHGTIRESQGQKLVAKGNSCESCHGGAKDWLAIHGDYGNGGEKPIAQLLNDRANETADHKSLRMATCEKAGMNRSQDAINIASNCLQCHVVAIEKLIDAGHPASEKFEFVEWAQGEVRHNFGLDAKQNAEVPSLWLDNGDKRTVDGRKKLMFIAGQMADLEVSLKARATVTGVKRGSLGAMLNKRIADAAGELEDIEFDDLKPVLAVLEADGISKRSLRKLTPNDKALYAGAAQKVRAASDAFILKHKDGDALPKMKLPSRGKGDVFGG